MRLFHKLQLRFRSLIRKSRVERDLADELHFHLEELIGEKLAKGMSADEARYAALRELGGVEQIKEECRDMRRVNHAENLIQDVRYGLRMLAKNPGFTAVAVLTFALGIGANTAIFSAVNAFLLRPLPYPNSSQLVRVWATNLRNGIEHDVASYPDLTDWASQSRSFQQIAAYAHSFYNLSGGNEPERVDGLRASTSLLDLLAIRPFIGRGFLPEEQQAGRSHVVLLTTGLWKSRFGAAPSIIGKAVKLNDEAYTVIGILPAQFDFPPNAPAKLVVPLEPDLNRGHGFLNVVARLKSGVTLARAQAEMDTICARLEHQYQQDRGVGVNLEPLRTSYFGQFKPALLILLGAVGFVLLIACANVANLFLGRTAGRQKELAVRAALGAGRLRLVRQLLTESLIVATVGGIMGLVLAAWGVGGLTALLSKTFSTPGIENTIIDPWVLGFTLAASFLTGLASGMAPALGASKPDLNESLEEGSRSLTGGPGRKRLRSALVVSEIALALVLFSGAALMIKSLLLLTRVDLGLEISNVLALDFAFNGAKYVQPEVRNQFLSDVLERVRALPSVRSAAWVADLPLTDNEDTLGFSIAGRPEPSPSQSPSARFNLVSEDYFRTFGIPLISGRDFTPHDSPEAPGVALINEAMARRFWPGQNPLGRQITLDHRRWYSIVGLVGDVRQMGPATEPSAEVYLSSLEDPQNWPYRTLVIRSAGDPVQLVGATEHAVWSVNKNQPVSNIRTMEEALSQSVAQPRAYALLLGIFAVLALVLAAVGLYGVVAYWVTERTHEIGVRMALGAQRVDAFRLVVGTAIRLALLGVGIGLMGDFILTRLMTGLLYRVRSTDPATHAIVCCLLVTVALVASYMPARRATKVDPMVALRYE
jgi:putative ABC transport system permease protein